MKRMEIRRLEGKEFQGGGEEEKGEPPRLSGHTYCNLVLPLPFYYYFGDQHSQLPVSYVYGLVVSETITAGFVIT